jgi:predicted nucleic acid-binding protein
MREGQANMNVMIDTNIILDDLLNRGSQHENACQIMELITGKKLFGYITTSSLTDVYYAVGKNMNEKIAREAVKKIIGVFQVISVDVSDCSQALDSKMGDFEDALIVICAEKAGLDCIITNDKTFLNEQDSRVPPISPVDFLLKFNP